MRAGSRFNRNRSFYLFIFWTVVGHFGFAYSRLSWGEIASVSDEVPTTAKCQLLLGNGPDVPIGDERPILSPHEEYIFQHVVANQRYPQTQAGISTKTLAYLYQQDPAKYAEILGPVTGDDIATLGTAMNRAHKAMNIKHQHAPALTDEMAAKSINLVTDSRLKGAFDTIRMANEFSIERVLKTFDPSFPIDKGFLFAKTFPYDGRLRIEAYAEAHPEIVAEVQELGRAYSRALADKNVAETAKINRTGLKQEIDAPPSHQILGPTGMRRVRSKEEIAREKNFTQALEQALEREVAQSFPGMSATEIQKLTQIYGL